VRKITRAQTNNGGTQNGTKSVNIFIGKTCAATVLFEFLPPVKYAGSLQISYYRLSVVSAVCIVQ